MFIFRILLKLLLLLTDNGKRKSFSESIHRFKKRIESQNYELGKINHKIPCYCCTLIEAETLFNNLCYSKHPTSYSVTLLCFCLEAKLFHLQKHFFTWHTTLLNH